MGRRISVNLPVRLVMSTGNVRWGRLRNLSITGALFESVQPLAAGRLVSIEPTTGSGHWPARGVKASVIWTRSGSAGLEWCEPFDSVPWARLHSTPLGESLIA